MIQEDQRKLYIPGVRKISWQTGEMCEFASALVAALECLGQSITYPCVLGTSGVAFRFTLNPGQWDFTNYSIRNITADPYEPICRAMWAAGREYTIREKGERERDLAAIIESIERGVPVLAFRMIGPSDCCIITGHDEGGEVLLGWSTFQDIPDDHNIPHDSTGYFRKPGWHEGLDGYVLIGRKTASPSPRMVYLESLRCAVRLLRTPAMGQKRTGLAGLAAWAEEMMQEEHFPTDDPHLLGLRYVSTAINITMLRDHCSAAAFLRQAAKLDGSGELSRAAGCYDEVMRIRSEMDELISDNFSPKAMKAIGDTRIRAAFAELILKIRDKEEEAVGCIERVVGRCEST